MPATASTDELVRALSLTSGVDAESIHPLLEGDTPQSEDALVGLAARLVDQRSRMERGVDYRLVGATSSTTSDHDGLETNGKDSR